jgi:ATP-binding cassette subfamily B protein
MPIAAIRRPSGGGTADAPRTVMLRRRYVCVRQADQSDCGPAALATIALHHGVRISREKLRDVTGTDRIGTNMAGLLRGAERLGLSARAVKGDWKGLCDVPLPAIVHVRTPEGLGHYVVLHRITKSGVIVADPGRGVDRLTRERFLSMWTGYALLLAPTRSSRAASRRAPAGASSRSCSASAGSSSKRFCAPS